MQLFFGSVVVVDGGETAIGNAARVRTDYRGHNLFQFGLGLFHSIATEFRHVKRVLAVTREDQAILEPRFVAGLQRNKLISTNVSRLNKSAVQFYFSVLHHCVSRRVAFREH